MAPTRALASAETDRAHIVRLYAEHAQLAPSPVVDLNRAVALAMAFGQQASLEFLDALTAEPLLEGYHLLPSVRGDLLAKHGHFDEADVHHRGAAPPTRNAHERELFVERAEVCAGGSTLAESW